MKPLLYLSLPLYALDQWSKHWILRNVSAAEPRIVIPDFFDLVHVTNSGAAFGSFANNNTFFIVLSCAALIFVLSLLFRRRTPDIWRDLSLGLLIAGILGNLTDRVLHGHVIDFLLFDLHMPFAHPWPAFNVADSCICIAVLCFIVQTLRQESARKRSAAVTG